MHQMLKIFAIETADEYDLNILCDISASTYNFISLVKYNVNMWLFSEMEFYLCDK